MNRNIELIRYKRRIQHRSATRGVIKRRGTVRFGGMSCRKKVEAQECRKQVLRLRFFRNTGYSLAVWSPPHPPPLHRMGAA
jgi:hypothetical protein